MKTDAVSQLKHKPLAIWQPLSEPINIQRTRTALYLYYLDVRENIFTSCEHVART